MLSSPGATARVFWHIDQHNYHTGDLSEHFVENIAGSLAQLIAQYHALSASEISVEAHCNFSSCKVLTDMVWYLGQYHIPVKRHMNPTIMTAQQAIMLRLHSLHGSDMNGDTKFPVCLITDDERLIYDCLQLLETRMILCTTLTEWNSAGVVQVLQSGGHVYQWSKEYGVGVKYPVFDGLLNPAIQYG
ncbi:uncharacterized protein LOC129590338 isoform X2 [Paramacrobiotus metropolitanus]|nr:uncharacterized protein LOC129590338 isoform X2 [Paramacrobiotus metropolitanus]